MQNSLLFYSTAEGKSFNEEKGFTYKIQCITKHSYWILYTFVMNIGRILTITYYRDMGLVQLQCLEIYMQKL